MENIEKIIESPYASLLSIVLKEEMYLNKGPPMRVSDIFIRLINLTFQYKSAQVA